MKSYPSAPVLPLILDRAATSLQPSDAFAGLTSTDRSAREEILHRARAIWESEGCPQNRELAHWLQAEVEILQTRKGRQ